MADRPQIRPQPVFTAATGTSMASSITGLPTIVDNKSMISYSFSWVGTTPVGTVSVQVSNDYSLDATGKVSNAGTWSAMELNSLGLPVTTIPVSGNTGNGMIDVMLTGVYAIRPIYTASSGTGTINCMLNAKVS